MKVKFGLVGRNIHYSFSKMYFAEKFKVDGLTNHSYENYDIDAISDLKIVLTQDPNIKGLNVTIPYKVDVMPLLHKISKKAAKIGAVNTIRISKKGKLKGYNTDWIGFTKSITPLLESHHKNALILGTGGASKAIVYALKKLKIKSTLVSREKKKDTLSYEDLDENAFAKYTIVINCSPVGTFPNVNECPKLPYELFTDRHIAYDLIYSPEESTFLTKAKEQGAVIKNGYSMLVFQAEAAWEIWNKKRK